MKFCKCGCGKEVKSSNSIFFNGHHNRDPEVKEKKKKSCMLKYGEDNPSKVKPIKLKKIETCIKNFGVDHPGQSKEIQLKSKISCVNRYGIDNPFKDKNMIKESYLKKLGVDNPSKLEFVKDKKITTSRINFGVDHPTQSKEIQNKIQESNIKKYGVPFTSQLKINRDKYRMTCIEKFGFDNYSKSFIGRKKCRESMIRMILSGYKDGSTWSPMIGFQEHSCFEELQKLTDYKILTGQSFISYFPDGYIKELNLIVEFYEKWHQHPRTKDHDLLRENQLINHLNCGFFIVHEKEWKENKLLVLEKFKIKILEQIKNLNLECEYESKI